MGKRIEINQHSFRVGWAVAWPGMLAATAAIIMSPFPDDLLVTAALGQGIYLAVQAATLRRIVGKEFSKFWIGVVREDSVGRRLTTRESVRLALRVVGPKVAIVGVFFLLHLKFPNRGFTNLGIPLLWFCDLSMFSSLLEQGFGGVRLQAFSREQPAVEAQQG